MKKVIMSLALLAACRTTTTTTMGPGSAPTSSSTMSGAQTGAPDPMSAVRGFMAAAKQTDLQTLGALWGDKDGPARDRLPRDELEKRELYIMRCLRHDDYQIVGDAPSLGGSFAMIVKLNYGDLSRSADVQVVQGPSSRWYVKDVNVIKLQDICMRRG